MWERFFDFDLQEVLYHLIQLGIAFLLAMPMAWDQELATRRMGLRTFPLVALASTGYILLARQAFGGSDGAAEAEARVLQGLVTGIGFLGGGAILKQGNDVWGTATAASIWNTAALGAAVAYGRYEIALLLSVLNFLVLRYFRKLKEYADSMSSPQEPEERRDGSGAEGGDAG